MGLGGIKIGLKCRSTNLLYYVRIYSYTLMLATTYVVWHDFFSSSYYLINTSMFSFELKHYVNLTNVFIYCSSPQRLYFFKVLINYFKSLLDVIIVDYWYRGFFTFGAPLGFASIFCRYHI